MSDQSAADRDDLNELARALFGEPTTEANDEPATPGNHVAREGSNPAATEDDPRLSFVRDLFDPSY